MATNILKPDEQPTKILVAEDKVKIVTLARKGDPGPIGPTGPPGDTVVGPQGPPGQDGVDADLHHTHVQNSPSASWTVIHNLNKYPTVTVVDSGNSIVMGQINYLDSNTIVINFTAPFSGKAYVN